MAGAPLPLAFAGASQNKCPNKSENKCQPKRKENCAIERHYFRLRSGGGGGDGSLAESNSGEHAEIQTLPARFGTGLRVQSATFVVFCTRPPLDVERWDTVYSERESRRVCRWSYFCFCGPRAKAKQRVELRGGGGGSGLWKSPCAAAANCGSTEA